MDLTPVEFILRFFLLFLDLSPISKFFVELLSVVGNFSYSSQTAKLILEKMPNFCL